MARAGPRLCLLLVLALALDTERPAAAQEIARGEYLRYVPLRPPVPVRQTVHTARLRLFGDAMAPDYRDVSPRNGIDDRRERLLMALAVRFAPIVVRNTTAVPMDWKRFVGLGASFPLHVDHWEVARTPVELVASEQIDLARLAAEPCPPGGPDQAGLPAPEDCRLLALVRAHDPLAGGAGRRPAPDPESERFTVLFLDFPGEDPASWRREYRRAYAARLPQRYEGAEKAYVHPFVAAGAGGTIELVLQYWFFYPFNDGPNNHEGDWEHLNVVIAPLSRVGGRLGDGDLAALLAREPDELDGADPLVIARLEYFFHSRVMILDHARPNVYRPRAEWEEQVRQAVGDRLGAEALFKAIRARAYRDHEERVINTHPVAFVGGDSKGLELLLFPPGGRNRDSHGTFPFPGLYRDVSAAGATEEIRRRFDLRDHVGPGARPWPEHAERFDTPARLELLPDWERIRPLVLEEAEARRQWSWLLLPIRWGYPAVASPFAGIVAGAETGNLAPPGPAYNSGWNRTGSGGGYARYDPHRLPSLFPLSPTDSFRNDLGFLNAPFAALINLPPFDLVYKLLLMPVRVLTPPPQAPVYFPGDEVPPRLVGFGLGIAAATVPEDAWTGLFFDPRLGSGARLAAAGPLRETTPFAADPTSLLFTVQFNLTPRLVAESALRRARSAVGFDAVAEAEPERRLPVQATLALWEYAGSVRYNVLTGRVQPFVRAGYGSSWYRLEDMRVGESRLGDGPWIRAPSPRRPRSLVPNTFHYGVGVEVLPWHRPFPFGPSVGFRLDWTGFTHGLGVVPRVDPGAGLEPRTVVTRGVLALSAMVSL